MIINSLSIQNIRSHHKFQTDLSPKINIITGGNGSGKTSVLEAIYIILQGTSFRSSDNNILRNKASFWRIEAELDKLDKRVFSYNSKLEIGRKKVVIDNKNSHRLSIKDKKAVVLFEPDDLRLLNGSPERRRRFIDRFISQLDILYSNNLHKYERALKQRNNLLKNPFIKNEDLLIWDIALSEYGAYLIEKRIVFIEQINGQLNDLYDSISKTNDIVSIHYSNTYIGNIKQKIINSLQKNLQRDKKFGYTSVGPHRDDLIFNLNNSPAINTASRGEIRTIILALKFIEIDIIKKLTGDQPIVLLDDVFSELDESRQKYLISNRESQIIITTTNANKANIKSKFKEIKL